MSRIGKKSIVIPPKVEVKLQDQKVSVKGPKGELSQIISPLIEVKIEDSLLVVQKKKIRVKPKNYLVYPVHL